MYYKRLFKKDNELLKKEILYDFMVLEKYHRGDKGESRQISLHCKYDFHNDREKYYNEEFDIYLKAYNVTDNVIEFVNRYGFEQTNEFPNGLKHLLGNYGMTIRAIDGFVA